MQGFESCQIIIKEGWGIQSFVSKERGNKSSWLERGGGIHKVLVRERRGNAQSSDWGEEGKYRILRLGCGGRTWDQVTSSSTLQPLLLTRNNSFMSPNKPIPRRERRKFKFIVLFPFSLK